MIYLFLVLLGFVITGLFIYMMHVLTTPTITKSYKSPKRPCKASWQVSVHGGNLYEVKCRNCGVRVESGGTPICKK